MRTPILLYHTIDENCAPDYRRWAVSTDRFRRHLDLLRDRGCQPVTMAQVGSSLASGKPLPKNSVAITFDDGLADFNVAALPLLERYGYASTLFIVTGFVGSPASWLAPLGEGDRMMMSWEEVARLPERNVECGAHTHTHPQLDIVTRKERKREIKLSKALLEERLGRRVVSFAYPHGYHTRSVASDVRAAGFHTACSVGSGNGRYGLQRLVVDEETPDSTIHAHLDGRLDTASPRLPGWMRWSLRTGWREYRRITAGYGALTRAGSGNGLGA
ncbi:polysaccharide deacetylase family protein [Devosia sp.]|uniref:polysaccharide deacetylase family protein n=1 Tax=Devosia sp. TaxID=1871048 RepID=UPI003A957391